MEAADVVGLSPGFKFDPDDEELVIYFLLPRVQGQPLPLDGIAVEDDPLSASPWELLDKHGRKDDAFFFAPSHGVSSKGSRQKRTCVGGGCWMGQKVCTSGKKLRVPVGDVETEIVWKKYMLNFHAEGEEGSTGWVMHEYDIMEPSALASSPLRLCRIRFSGHGKNRKRKTVDSGEGDGAAARAAALPKMAEPTPPEEHHPAASQFQPSDRPDPVPVLVLEDVNVDGAVVSCGAVPQETSSDVIWTGEGDATYWMNVEIDHLLEGLKDDDYLFGPLGDDEFAAMADLCGLPPAAEANADGAAHEQIKITAMQATGAAAACAAALSKMPEPTPPEEHHPAAFQFQPSSSPDPVPVVVLEDVDVDGAVVGCGAVPQEASSDVVWTDEGDATYWMNADTDYLLEGFNADDDLFGPPGEFAFAAMADPCGPPPAAEANADDAAPEQSENRVTLSAGGT
ncbi:hypothetical protein ABZP36_014599 [Zizania latifolia]